MHPNTLRPQPELPSRNPLRSKLSALLGAGALLLAVGCEEPHKAKADEPKAQTTAKHKSEGSPRVGVGISLRGRPYLKVRPPRHHKEHSDHKTKPHESAKPAPKPAPTTRTQVKSCLVKGNIGNGGKKLYHVAGSCPDYAKTVISPEKGERCFNSESAARAAGWKKAGNCK